MSNTRPTWFITGASSGLGLAFARHAVDQGYNVVATARTPAKLAALVASAPTQVLALALDVAVPGDAERAVAAARARFGRIDVLLNNAGYGIVGAFEETPEAELRAQMETNFFGAVAMTRAVLPTLREQQSGAVVNISSLGGQLWRWTPASPKRRPDPVWSAPRRPGRKHPGRRRGAALGGAHPKARP